MSLRRFALLLGQEKERIAESVLHRFEKERELSLGSEFPLELSLYHGRIVKLLHFMAEAMESQEPLDGISEEELLRELTLIGIHPRDVWQLKETLEIVVLEIFHEQGQAQGSELLETLHWLNGFLSRALTSRERAAFGEYTELLSTLGQMRVAVFRAAPDSRLLFLNQAGAEILGARSPQELLGQRFADFYLDEKDRDSIRNEMLAKGKIVGSRFKARRLDGQVIWLETNFLVKLGLQGEVSHLEGFGRDVTSLVTAEEEVRKLSRFLSIVIDNANLWLNVIDEKAQMLIWNKAAETISGYSREEVIGHAKIWRWLYPDEAYRQELTEKALQILSGKEMHDMETQIQTKHGEKRAISWHSHNLSDEQGRYIGAVILGLDITEQKALRRRLEEQKHQYVVQLEKQVSQRTVELERANKELKKLDEMKDRFLANISHELRTPLVSGLGYVDLILEGGLGTINERVRKGLKTSSRNLKRLVGMIDDLLAFVRQDREREQLNVQSFKLSELVKECITDLQGSVRRDIRMRLDVPQELPLIFGDREKIRRVFSNLLSNAEKFTEEDAHVEIGAAPVSGCRVEVRVMDNGVGIPPEERTRVFERLYRSSGSGSSSPGTGIGLSLVKEILELHDCTVRAEGRDGKGTAIVFTLPLTEEQD
jgi:PAS domain S-box-containing protein